jgi:hypothetical protein
LALLTDDSVAMRECLRTKSIKEIHNGVLKIGPSRLDVNFAKFTSRQDDRFFPRDFFSLMHEAPPKPTIMGHCRLDALAYSLIIFEFIISKKTFILGQKRKKSAIQTLLHKKQILNSAYNSIQRMQLC